jgi:hypothetical protein
MDVEDIDSHYTSRYGDKWFLLRQHIEQGLARPVPEDELQRLEADYRRLQEHLESPK